MKRLVAAALLLAACGGGAPSLHVAPHGGRTEGRAGDASWAIVPRPLGETVHVLLAVDAGTRDATVPPIATLAVWAAAQRGGVDGFAAPDFVGLSATCRRDALDACVAGVYRALATRSVSEGDLAALRARLRDARARAAGDDARRADALAIAGALDGAAATDALGTAEDDAHLDAAAVSAFLAAHFGPARSRLFVVGTVDEASVSGAVERAAASLLRAGASSRADRHACGAGSRDARSAGGRDAGGASRDAHVEAGEHGAASVALCTSTARARAVALAADADVVPLRGGALVVLRGTDARRLVAKLEAARLEAGTGGPDPAPPGPAREAARAEAAAWAAGGSGDAEGEHVSLGLIVAAARDADPAADALAAQARAALEAGLADAAPTVRGTLGEGASSVVAGNGARVETRRADGTPAIAVRFAGGASGEPRNAHGRTALVAELLAERCATQGVTLSAAAGATSFGVDATASDARALDAVLACLLSAAPDAGALMRAQAALTADPDDGQRLRIAAARLLAPEAPGLVAPRGDPATPPTTMLADVADVLAQARVGARTSVAVVAPEPADATAKRAARRAAVLPAGTAVPDDVPVEPAHDDLLAAASRDGTTHVVLAWRAPAGADVVPDDARAIASALAAVLDTKPGLRVVATAADGAAGVAWVAVALDADDDALDALPASWADATASLDAPTLARARDATVAALALLRGTTQSAAATLAEARLAPRTTRRADLAALAHALFAVAPRAQIAAVPPAHPRAAPPLVRPRPPVRRAPARRRRAH